MFSQLSGSIVGALETAPNDPTNTSLFNVFLLCVV